MVKSCIVYAACIVTLAVCTLRWLNPLLTIQNRKHELCIPNPSTRTIAILFGIKWNKLTTRRNRTVMNHTQHHKYSIHNGILYTDTCMRHIYVYTYKQTNKYIVNSPVSQSVSSVSQHHRAWTAKHWWSCS